MSTTTTPPGRLFSGAAQSSSFHVVTFAARTACVFVALLSIRCCCYSTPARSPQSLPNQRPRSKDSHAFAPATSVQRPASSIRRPSPITCPCGKTITARGHAHHQSSHHGEHLPPYLRLAPSPLLVRLPSCLAPALPCLTLHMQPASVSDAPLTSVHSCPPRFNLLPKHDPTRTLTSIALQGDRDGHHHDRAAECWQDFAIESSGGECLPDREVASLHPRYSLRACPTNETLSREESSLLSTSILALRGASSSMPPAQLLRNHELHRHGWSKR